MALYNKKSNRLTGLTPLAYMGSADVDASAQVVWANRAPTQQDYDNWYLGALWIDESIPSPGDPEVWMLVKKDAQVATWIRFGGGFGDMVALRAQDGLIAYPSSGIVNVYGSSVINTTAAVANTLSVNLTNGTDGQVIIGGGTNAAWGTITSTGGTITITLGANTINMEVGPTVATSYETDAGTATPAANVLKVLGGDNINTAASGNEVIVHLNETIHWPNTNAAGTSGMIYLGGAGGTGGTRYIHNYGDRNVFMGSEAGNLTHTSIVNVAIGYQSQAVITNGGANTTVGAYSGTHLTNSSDNSAYGEQSLFAATTASHNTALGYNALRNLLTGNYNLGVGWGDTAVNGAGVNYTTNESSNICISNNGTVGENNTLRIGDHGVGNGQQNRCFIAGIRGITTGVADAIAVLIDSAYQLGTVSSSRRYKTNINDMADESSIIYSLRPVTFNFKEHPTVPAWGLIAEEVVDVFPQLVVFDPETGMPESVKYHDLPVLLLNELQKQHSKIEKQQEQIKNLKDRVRILEEQVAMIISNME